MNLQQRPPHSRSGSAEKASPFPWPLLLPMKQQPDPLSPPCSGILVQISSRSCRPPSSSNMPLLALAGAALSGVTNLQKAAGPQASEGGLWAAAASVGQHQQLLGQEATGAYASATQSGCQHQLQVQQSPEKLDGGTARQALPVSAPQQQGWCQGPLGAHAANTGYLTASASAGQHPCSGRSPDSGPPVLGGPGSLESPVMASGPDPGSGPAHRLELPPVWPWQVS